MRRLCVLHQSLRTDLANTVNPGDKLLIEDIEKASAVLIFGHGKAQHSLQNNPTDPPLAARHRNQSAHRDDDFHLCDKAI